MNRPPGTTSTKSLAQYAASIGIVSIYAGIAFILLAGCGSTDVVARYALSSFSSILDASKDRVVWVEEASAGGDGGSRLGVWELASPGGDSLSMSADFAGKPTDQAENAFADRPDMELRFDASPFLTAGLDPAKLPVPEANAPIGYFVKDGSFIIQAELGTDVFSPEARKTMGATFAQILKTNRSRVGYHEKLDHYGIKLGEGIMFEWARDMSKNDKDIVFVLSPEPLVKAGLDIGKLEGGWVFASVEMKDEGGKIIFADKLLKPFDLR